VGAYVWGKGAPTGNLFLLTHGTEGGLKWQEVD
jgi:hypothetical protein